MSFSTNILKNGLNRFDVGDIIVRQRRYDKPEYFKVVSVYNDTVYGAKQIISDNVSVKNIETINDFEFISVELTRKVITEKFDKWKSLKEYQSK